MCGPPWVLTVIAACGSSAPRDDVGPTDGPSTDGARYDELVRNEGQIDLLAVSRTHVYYAVCAGASGAWISRVSKSGGTPERVVAATGCVAGLAVDDAAIYWSTNSGTIAKLAHDAPALTAPTELFHDGTLSGRSPSSLAIDAESVYFLHPSNGAVTKVDKAGGPPVPLTTAETGAFTNYDIAVDASDVYWAAATETDNTGVLRRVPVHGGDSHVVVTGLGGTPHLSVDANAIYYASAHVATSWNWTVSKLEASGSSVLVSGPDRIVRVRSDGGAAYVATTSLIERVVSLTPGAPATPVASSDLVTDVQDDDTRIYWSSIQDHHSPGDDGGGAIFSIAK